MIIHFTSFQHLPSPARGEHRLVLAVSPGNSQWVPGHRASPGNTGPTDIVRNDGLDNGIVGGVGLDVGRNGYAVSDALVYPVQHVVGRKHEAGVGVAVDGISLRRHFNQVSTLTPMI